MSGVDPTQIAQPLGVSVVTALLLCVLSAQGCRRSSPPPQSGFDWRDESAAALPPAPALAEATGQQEPLVPAAIAPSESPKTPVTISGAVLSDSLLFALPGGTSGPVPAAFSWEGDPQKVLTRAREMQRESPNSPQANLVLGIALGRAGQKGAAIARFSQALRLDPELGSAYLQRGMLRFGQQSYRQAAEDLQAARERGVETAQLLTYLGLSHLHLRDDASAETAASDALELQPDLPEAYYVRCLARLRSGKVDEARKDHESLRATGGKPELISSCEQAFAAVLPATTRQ